MREVNHGRVGKFYVHLNLISDDKDLVQSIMGKCVIVRAECLYHRPAIEYIAYSDEFRELGKGEAPPEYEWIVNREIGEVSAMEVKS